MTLEQELIKLFLNKDHYYRYKEYIKDYAYSEEILKIIKTIDTYYEVNPQVATISLDDLRTFFFVKNPKLPDPKAQLYGVLFDSLKSTEESSTPLKDLLEQFLERDYATKIANVCFESESKIHRPTGDGRSLSESIQNILEDYDAERLQLGLLRDADTDDTSFVKVSVEELVKSVKKDGLSFRLPELQLAVGPINKGDFIVVVARPETGKTTFIASEVSHLAAQLPPEACVAWVNNEERDKKITLRIVQAALQRTLVDIESDPKDAMEQYTRLVGTPDRIKVTTDEAGLTHVRDLDKWFKKIKPSIIVFDTLDKVRGFEDEARDDLRLGELYKWARLLSKTYGPVLASSQADATADNQQFVYAHQLRGSKTDKQGEADVIITLGRLLDPKHEHTRWLHLPKNKSAGCREERYRHGFFEIKIIPDRATFEGLLKP